MALVVKDRVKQTTTTTGTGSIVLNGNVSGFQTFAAALTDGDTTYYGIFEPSTNEYEVGLGTWTESTSTLARTTVLESSNSGSAVSLTAQAEVFITQPAEKAVYLNSNGDVDLGGNKILFGNLYSTTGDLPSASTYHGMFAHVHGTGKAYYAHAGNWIELVNEDTSGNVSMGGNLTVTGDLTVNGTTTTIDTTNTVVTDSLIELANGTTGTPANDAGLVIERGDSNNAFIGFDESADKFIVGTGSFTGASTGDLTVTTGTLVANVEGNVTGNVTGDVTGNADTATALETARTIGGVSFNGTANINLPGVNTSGNQDTSGNAATATALETGRTISLTGAVTGTSASFDGSGNVSIATTATSDPTLTLSGDVTGSATFTNLGNATLTATVADDSHNHVISNIDNLQTTLDAKSPLADPDFTGVASFGDMITVGNSGTRLSGGADLIEIYGGTASFHMGVQDGTGRVQMRWNASRGTNPTYQVSSEPSARYEILDVTSVTDSLWKIDHAASGTAGATISYTNILSLGTTTFTYNSNEVWHAGNDGSGSGLDADTLDGVQGSSYLRSDTSDTFTGTLTLTGSMNASGTVTAESLQEDYDALSGTSPAPDADNAGAFSLTTSGNTTFTFGSCTSGKSVAFILELTAGGTHTVTWPSSVEWAGGTAPDAPASGETDIYVFWSRDGGTTWYGVLSSDAAS